MDTELQFPPTSGARCREFKAFLALNKKIVKEEENTIRAAYDCLIADLKGKFEKGRSILREEFEKVSYMVTKIKNKNPNSKFKVTINSHTYKHRHAKSSVLQAMSQNTREDLKSFNLSIIEHMLPDLEEKNFDKGLLKDLNSELGNKEKKNDLKVLYETIKVQAVNNKS